MFNWFKSAKKTEQMQEQKAATLCDDATQEQIIAYVTDNASLESDARQQALSRISDINQLQILGTQQPALIKDIATQLAASNESWIASITPEFRQTLLSRHEIDSELKQTLITSIDDKSQAKKLISNIQDKRSQQLLREKVRTLTQFEKDNKVLIESAESILHRLDILTPLPWDSLYSGKITKIERDWDALDNDKLTDTIKKRYQKLYQIGQTTIEAHAEEHAKQQAEQAIRDKQQACIEQLEERITKLQHDANQDLEFTAAFLKEQKTQWQQAESELKPSLSTTTQYEQALAKIEQFYAAQSVISADKIAELNKLLKADNITDSIDETIADLSDKLTSAPWPKFLSISDIRQQAQSLLDALKKKHDVIKKTNDKQLSHIRHKNRELGQKLSDKNLIAASRLNHYIEQKIQKLPQKWQTEAQEIIKNNRQELTQLEELNAFATEPKKEQLCKQMEALINNELFAKDPEALANQIQSLQDEWKKTNTIIKDNDPLWERFIEAAHKAWEPCAIHYQAEQDKREANVAKRQALCDQIQHFIDTQDWDNADWKAIIGLEKTAHNEFRAYEPVDYKLNRPVQKLFYALLDALKGKIKKQQAVFLADKDTLIERAENLSEEELDKAIEQAKFLQQRWKNIPTLRIGEDRKYWKKFQAACNAVFERLGEKRDADRAERQDIINNADEIINNIYALGKSADDELTKSRDQFDALKQAYDELEEMPENVSKRKQSDLRKACDFYEKQVDNLALRKEEKVQDMLYQLSLLLNEYDNTPTEQLKLSIQEHIETLENSSLKSKLEPIKIRFENTPNDSSETELETLAIKYEILADIETPEAYKSQRMQYQLGQLKKGLGKKQSNNARESILELELAWAALSTKDNAIREQLEARRKQARKNTKTEDNRKT